MNHGKLWPNTATESLEYNQTRRVTHASRAPKCGRVDKPTASEVLLII